MVSQIRCPEEERKMNTIVEDCPCTVNCVRHGDCVACIAFHRSKGWPLVACMQELLNQHNQLKKGKGN